MTLVDPDQKVPEQDLTVETGATEADVPPRRRGLGSAVVAARAAGPRVVGVALALVVIWLICAGPVAHLWYQSRQQGLRAQAASATTQLGSEKPTIRHAVAVLEDPTIGLNVDIAQGDSPQILRGGPGHRLGTPLPGAKGNSVVVGHSRDWGAPFRGLAKLTVGSEVYLQAHPGVFHLPETGDFIYTVRSTTVTSANSVRFAAPTTDYRLTLVTDVGRLSGNRVLVVVLVSGTLGRTAGHSPLTSLDPGKGRLLNGDLVLLVLGLGVAVLAARFLRQAHRRVVWVGVLVPIVALVAFLLFLEFDVIAFRALA
jgi:sortase A